jgi:hypothetical protein
MFNWKTNKNLVSESAYEMEKRNQAIESTNNYTKCQLILKYLLTVVW